MWYGMREFSMNDLGIFISKEFLTVVRTAGYSKKIVEVVKFIETQRSRYPPGLSTSGPEVML